MPHIKTVDAYIESQPDWQPELEKLRKIVTSMGLQETMKWGMPCYTHAGKNVLSIGAFKSYVGLWFFQGAQMPDPENVLINAQQGKTKALRQWRFEKLKDIKPTRIKPYIKEAMAVIQSGNEIKPDRAKPLVVPPELDEALSKNKKARAGFKALTLGRQREYADYIAEAKREATKQSRLDKILPMMAQGMGLNDKYRRS